MSVAELVTQAPAGSPEWHAARANGLGGSEVAAALGLSPWESPFSLWHRKKGNLPPVAETEAMRWGKLLEPVVIAEWERQSLPPGWWWERHNPGTYVRDGWRVASPDHLYGIGLTATEPAVILEAKTADGHTAHEWGPSGSDDPAAVPIHYRIQTLWYGSVLDIHDLHLAVLIGGNDWREYDVPWDQNEVDQIVDLAGRFWQTVINDQPPALDDSDATYRAVRQLHPDVSGDDVPVDMGTVTTWQEADAVRKGAALTIQLCKAKLTDQMGSARYGLDPMGERVVRRDVRAGGTPHPVLVRERKTKENAA